MLELGLAFLVYFAPLLALALLVGVLGGFRSMDGRRCCAAPKPRPVAFRAGARTGTVLASDAERDEALEVISHAVGDGRLTLAEAERRIDAVLRSRHRHELRASLAGLPPLMATAPATPSRSPWRVALLAVAGFAVIAAVAIQAVAGLWELWPVAVAACSLWAARPRR